MRALLLTALLLALALPAGAATLRGTAFDGAERPLAGVTISLVRDEAVLATVITDARGRYELPNLAAGTYTLLARKAGLTTERQRVTLAGTAQVLGVSFRLRPWEEVDWSIAGSVVGGGTKGPVPGAVVVLRPLPAAGQPAVQMARREVNTSEVGAFRFTDVPAGRYSIEVSAPGFLTAQSASVALGVGGTRQRVDVVLVRAPSFDVTVTRPDGAPYAGGKAELHLLPRFATGKRCVVDAATNGAGVLRAVDVAPGRYRVILKAPGCRPLMRDVVVRVGEDTRLAHRLAPVFSLRGRVLKPDGTPAAGAYVECRQAEQTHLDGGSTRSAEDGTFEAQGLGAGPAVVRARMEGFVPAEARIELGPGAVAPVDLRLAAGLALTGVVRDAAGKPLPRAGLTWVPGASRSEEASSGGQPWAKTNEEGRFRVAGVPPGPGRLRATAPGYAAFEQVLDLREAPAAPLDVTLRASPAGSLRGRVLNADGTPASGVTVKTTLGVGAQATTHVKTDAAGAFVYPDVEPGRGSVTVADAPVRGSWPCEAKPGAEAVVPDFKLPPVGTVEGTLALPPVPIERPQAWVTPALVAADGRVLSRAEGTRLYSPLSGSPEEVEARPALPTAWLLPAPSAGGFVVFPDGTLTEAAEPRGGVGRTPVGVDGAFRATAVAGPCRVQPLWSYCGDWYTQPGRTVAVPRDGAARVEVPVAVGEALAIRMAADEDGPGGAFVILHHRDTLEWAATFYAPRGATVMAPCLAPGEYVATLRAPGYAGIRRAVSVRAGQESALELRLGRGVSLRGKVAGALPAMLFVSAESDGGLGAARVAPDGTFAIDHLLPGTYTLSLWADGERRIVRREGVGVGEAGAEGVTLEW